MRVRETEMRRKLERERKERKYRKGEMEYGGETNERIVKRN